MTKRKEDPYKERRELQTWKDLVDEAEKEAAKKLPDPALVQSKYWQAIASMRIDNSLDGEFVQVVLALASHYRERNLIQAATALVRELVELYTEHSWCPDLAEYVCPDLILACNRLCLFHEADRLADYAEAMIRRQFEEKKTAIERTPEGPEWKEIESSKLRAWFGRVREDLEKAQEDKHGNEAAAQAVEQFKYVTQAIRQKIM